MEAILSGVVTLPWSVFKPYSKDKAVRFKMYDPITEESKLICAYRRDGDLVHIPRQYGLSLLQSLGIDNWVDATSAGYEANFPKAVKLRPGQDEFVDGLLARSEESYDAVACADTGKGKTVMSLEVIRCRRRTALVVVDQEFLRDQWIKEAKQHLGLKDEDIGIIQGKRCDYEGKSLSIAMIQTIYNRKYEKELYDYFGTVVFDEVHTAGSGQFSNALSQFHAEFRFGVSATPDRRDALQRILLANLGPVVVQLTQSHRKSEVRFINHDTVLGWYANISPKTGRYISELVSDTSRNAKICAAIEYMYSTGRDVLAVSDRIEHLDTLMTMCSYMGIPREDMGLVAGYDLVWRYAKEATPKRKPEHLHPKAEYTPVCIQQTKKRVPKAVLDTRKNEARIIFATYGMFTKGVDVPRLTAGIDCTPRSQAKQVHGRILRPMEGKLRPIWVTIRDRMSYKAEYQFVKRLLEYQKSNVEIVQWDLRKGIRRVDAEKLRRKITQRIQTLKNAKIITQRDGRNIMRMANTEQSLSKE